MRTRLLAFAGLPCLVIAAPAKAVDAFYLGSWRFESAVVAPWADPKAKPDSSEKNALMGKTVALRPKEIVGPQVLACKRPKYRLTNYTADLLFQGAFQEMREHDNSVDPLKLAASLGFVGASFRTLETGCEIDWHFVDPATAEVALNDYVYTLKRR